MKIRLFTIPKAVTLGNLLCGSCAAVPALVYGDIVTAFWLLAAAAVFDFADGAVARIMDQYTQLGVQLDSLSDAVSFGFAPAAIMFALSTDAEALWARDGMVDILRFLIFIMAAFSALRLAKFNIDPSQSDEFCGLPTPANALFCAGLAVLVSSGRIEMPLEAITATALVMSVLLVAPLRMFSLKFHNFGWRDNGLRYVFLALSAVLIVAAPVWSVPAIIIMYVVISAVRHAAGHGAHGDGEQSAPGGKNAGKQ